MTQSQAINRLITEVEAADLLGLSVKTLRRWRWAGHPPRFIKLGGAVRYDMEDLRAFMESGRRTSTSDPGPEAVQRG